MGTPIKLEGGSGDLKEMTTGEEAWLAYQCGLQLASMADTDTAALTTTSGGTDIGTYTNTFFNEAVGTHPGTSITSGSTATTLYQNAGSATEAGSDFHRPIHWNTDKFEEMDDTELNTFVDRLLGLTFANDYPGNYQLASSSPGATYDTHIAGVFSDTRTDGTTVTYNIYQRQSIASPPTEVKCVKVYNDITSFDGLKEMSNAEIAYTLGQRMKTRIMSSADNIGAYQLRSSAQGAPSATGTWVAKGTATDTKQTTGDVDYSDTYVGNYSGTYSDNYVGNYSNTFTRTRVTTYSGNYVNPNAIQYIRQRYWYRYYGPLVIYYYTGNYLGPANYVGNYVGNFVGNYTGTFAGDYIGNYTGTYAGDYIGNYLGETIQSGNETIETYTLYVRTA